MGILRGTSSTVTVNSTVKITDTEKPGQVHTLKFKVVFKSRDYDDAKALIARLNNPDSDVSEASIVRDDIIKWEGLEGDGGAVEFNDDNLSIALQHPEYRLALFNAWGEAQLRRLLAHSKN